MNSIGQPERILLVEDIWDSVAECHDAVPLTEAQKAELDRRLDATGTPAREVGGGWSGSESEIVGCLMW